MERKGDKGWCSLPNDGDGQKGQKRDRDRKQIDREREREKRRKTDGQTKIKFKRKTRRCFHLRSEVPNYGQYNYGTRWTDGGKLV